MLDIILLPLQNKTTTNKQKTEKERLFPSCSSVETEMHALLSCLKYDVRKSLFEKVLTVCPGLYSFTNEEKMGFLLSDKKYY